MLHLNGILRENDFVRFARTDDPRNIFVHLRDGNMDFPDGFFRGFVQIRQDRLNVFFITRPKCIKVILQKFTLNIENRKL